MKPSADHPWRKAWVNTRQFCGDGYFRDEYDDVENIKAQIARNGSIGIGLEYDNPYVPEILPRFGWEEHRPATGARQRRIQEEYEQSRYQRRLAREREIEREWREMAAAFYLDGVWYTGEEIEAMAPRTFVVAQHMPGNKYVLVEA